MRLLQFSTSHYCRKVRLALGYKQIPYEVENLTPGAHRFKLKPLVGLTTVPVLLPESPDGPVAVGDSTEILKFLEGYSPEPSWAVEESEGHRRAWLLEDWLDESIGTATRFLYYDFRAKEGKSVNPSWFAQTLVKVVRVQYDISPAGVALARQRLMLALTELGAVWQESPYLVGDRLSVADITAAGLLSPLALIPQYRQDYPWLFERIEQIHECCQEPLPPGLMS
ncbi:MAG: glutathione S-transferase family protein [Phormidium sp. GEM2.Bin31]|nr:glutathione S-transferase family protein [Phormidium sp. BM_Day4_Bin.17]TVR13517.1 MAG: glutathione S-transferase family protein [Phormidium sp. GEM2.Bin31]UCJ12449.1 MAG: glutathione S-transferase family protein [Phormidium sp. PBR-2020]